MNTNSIWTESSSLPSYPKLTQPKKTDVLIIGGGIAGILCAYFLHQANVPYILTEANTICSGITQNTTAKITAQHGLIYQKICKTYDMETAMLYLEANEAALKEYFRLSQTISCDFMEQDNFVYSLSEPKKLELELDVLAALHHPVVFVKDVPLPLSTVGAICFPKQAQFHPLKFLSALSKPLHIYEHTKVTEFLGTAVLANGQKITADKIIIATHFPFFNKHGSYFMKQYQHRSYVLALSPASKVPIPSTHFSGMYVDESEQGLSFRSFYDTLLLGGGGHRTGKYGGNWTALREFAKIQYASMTETNHWATQDCITLDDIPYIGQYSAKTPNLYVATGFNKWGMSSAMVAGKLLCDLILDKKTPYAPVFSPSRNIWHPKLFINGFETTKNLLIPTKKRCPHLGCALKWNKEEHSWDCPCHGSRFTENGKLLDNPATDNLPSAKHSDS